MLDCRRGGQMKPSLNGRNHGFWWMKSLKPLSWWFIDDFLSELNLHLVRGFPSQLRTLLENFWGARMAGRDNLWPSLRFFREEQLVESRNTNSVDGFFCFFSLQMAQPGSIRPPLARPGRWTARCSCSLDRLCNAPWRPIFTNFSGIESVMKATRWFESIWIVTWPPWNSSYSCHIAMFDGNNKALKQPRMPAILCDCQVLASSWWRCSRPVLTLERPKRWQIQLVSTLFHWIPQMYPHYSIYFPYICQLSISQIFENTLNTLHRLICSI